MEQYSNLKNVKNKASSKNLMSRGILILISFLFTVFICNGQVNEKYDKIFAPSEGLRIVQQGDKYGYIDETGKEITSLKYDIAKSFSFGYALVRLENKPYLINQKGEEFNIELLDTDKELGLVRIKINEKFGYIDRITVKLVTPIKYDKADKFSFDKNFVFVQIGDKIGIIGKNGEITAPKYDKISSSFLSEGLRAVKQDEKFGFINEQGKEITLIKYDDYYSFKEGFVAVIQGDKWGYIDKTGKVVIPFKYDSALGFKGGFAAVKLDGVWIDIDKNGNKTYKKVENDDWDF